MSDTVRPSKRSCTRTRRVHRWRWSVGTLTDASPSRRAAISVIASASRRKSSSARSPSANWASTSPERTPRPNGVRRWARSASRASAARSRSIVTSMPGPLDLDHDGLAGAQHAPGGSGRSTPRRAAPTRTRRRPHRCRRARPGARRRSPPAARAARGSATWPARRTRRPAAGRRGWRRSGPSLTYTPPAPSSTRRRRTAWLSTSTGGAGAARPEALPPGQADELAVATEHGDPPPDGADRAGGRRRVRPAPRWPATRAGPAGRARRRPSSSPGRRWPRRAGRGRRHPSPTGSRRGRRRARRLQPSTPASSAVPHPRRMPSRRSETLVIDDGQDDADDDAHGHAERRAEQEHAHPSPPGHGGAPAPHSTRPVRSATSATSSVRGWNASATSRAIAAVALTPRSNSYVYVTQAPSATNVRTARSAGRSCSDRSNARHPGSVLGTSVASPSAHAAGRPQAHLDGVGAGLVGVQPEPGVAPADAHAADRPAGRERGDARHGGRARHGLGHQHHDRLRSRSSAPRRSGARPA